MSRPLTVAPLRLTVALAVAALLSACSARRLATSGLAGALSGMAESFAREPDPELVRESLPFALEAIEGVLIDQPENDGLRLAASAAFLLYSDGFLAEDAAALAGDYERAELLSARVLALELRARDHALAVLEHRHPDIGQRLRRSPHDAAAELGAGDVEAAYWTAAAWGLAISRGKERPELVADVDAVRALLKRALELEESWSAGAIHAALISIESLPAAMGGSEERARMHFQRALELGGEGNASLYVSLAESVSLPRQDRAEFEELLGHALSIDPAHAPSRRLLTTLAQRRARRLLASIDELFLPPLD